MAGEAGLKAGLIGVAVMSVVTLTNHLLSMSGSLGFALCMCGVILLIYASIGALAGIFLAPPRVPGKGAGAGAIAGLLSGAAAGVIGSVLMITGASSALDQMPQLAESGMNTEEMVVIPLAVCHLAMGAGLAAIGGAIFAAVKSD